MSKQKFKVGDRVRAVRSCVAPGPLGDIGKIVYIDHTDSRLPYLVQIECEGYRPSVWRPEVEHIREKHPVIVITTDGKTTTATMREGKKVIKTATAKCSDKDTFSFAEGARIAFERLQGRDPFPVKEPERPKKLVCVKPYGNNLKAGKVYNAHWHGDDFCLDIGFDGEVRDGRYRVGFVTGEAEFIPFVED